MDAIPNTFYCNGNSINGNENIANAFNHYFTNIGSKLDSKIPSSDRDTYFHVLLMVHLASSILIKPTLRLSEATI